jgi:hypothetical protein
MAIDDRDPRGADGAPGWVHYRTAGVGMAVAAVAAGVGWASAAAPDQWPAVAAALLGVVGMLTAGYAVARRPKDSVTLGLAAAAALLGGLATNPAWDSIRLMQFVMAGTAAAAALIVRLPRTGQRVAFSLMVLYHFAGIVSAITSPPPTPWLTGQLWTRVFRPHLEFCYVNNAYQFYSPQPGPAQVLWFCIIGEDGQARWYKTPQKKELLDPLGIEYFRRLSLTERANQTAPVGPTDDMVRRRLELAADLPLAPDALPVQQYRAPNEHGRHIIAGYAEHVAKVLGTGRWRPDGTPVPVKAIKVYLTQHQMLTQVQFRNNDDPYAPETYLPFFVGQFDAAGRPKMTDFDRRMLYWVVPIYRQPTGVLKNVVAAHAADLQGEFDPFDPALEWRAEPK